MASSTDQNTTVVLADDHNIVREGITALCAKEGLRVLGQCSDGAAAVQMITELKPDFALLDMNMPVLTGVEVIRRLRAIGCTTKLLILSISRQDATVTESIRAGADAYLLKDGPSRHLFDAISFVRDDAALPAKSSPWPRRRARTAGSGGGLEHPGETRHPKISSCRS